MWVYYRKDIYKKHKKVAREPVLRPVSALKTTSKAKMEYESDHTEASPSQHMSQMDTISVEDDTSTSDSEKKSDSDSEVSVSVRGGEVIHPEVVVQTRTMRYFDKNGFIKAVLDPYRYSKSTEMWTLYDNQRMYERLVNIDLIPQTFSLHAVPTNDEEEKKVFDLVKDIPMHQTFFNNEARGSRLTAVMSRENKRKFGRFTWVPRSDLFQMNGIFVEDLKIIKNQRRIIHGRGSGLLV